MHNLDKVLEALNGPLKASFSLLHKSRRTQETPGQGQSSCRGLRRQARKDSEPVVDTEGGVDQGTT